MKESRRISMNAMLMLSSGSVLLLSLLFPLTSVGQVQQSIQDDSQWTYPLDYDWFIKMQKGDCRYEESFRVIGENEKNGRTYFTLKFIRYSTETDNGSSGGYFHNDDEIYMFHIITLQKDQSHNQISIREEGGRFLVDKEEYMTALKDENYGGRVGNPDYVPYETTNGNELILYDFTKCEGEVYALSEDGEPIKVSSVESIVTDDDVRRNLLTLSNGLKIIEGIGCINSTGTLIYYLNPGKRNHQTTYLVWYMYDHGPANLDFVLYNNNYKERLIATDITPKSAETFTNNLFDLQGRRLNSQPTKGIYIRDGRKVVVK